MTDMSWTLIFTIAYFGALAAVLAFNHGSSDVPHPRRKMRAVTGRDYAKRARK